MALTELQLPDKGNFYARLGAAASEFDRMLSRMRDIAEFIGFIDTNDLDAMGIPTGQIRTDLSDFRIALNELLAFYDGTGATQTNVPADVIDKIRYM